MTTDLTCRIPLTRGFYALVDIKDLPMLRLYKWQAGIAHGRPRAQSWRYVNGKLRTILMHRLIMQTAPGLVVDHINGDSLDNRRTNLRNCTQRQNIKNQRLHRTNKSGYRGVSWRLDGKESSGFWIAQISVNMKKLYLGRFHSKKEAAIAYDRAARKHHGRFAALNFPDTTEVSCRKN